MPKRFDRGVKSRSSSTTYSEKPPKIEDLGVTRDQSSKWQKLAAIPERHFEAMMSAAKDAGVEITTRARQGRRRRPKIKVVTDDNEIARPRRARQRRAWRNN